MGPRAGGRPAAGAQRVSRRVIGVRSDSLGDVLVTGPALRAIASACELVLMCGPRGEAAARVLPGVSEVLCAELPWIDPEPKPVSRAVTDELIARLMAARCDEAVIFTSFHQSALPLALLMRMAGVRRISAISEDYPGSLLDVRSRDPGDVHEVERALSLAEAAGFRLPEGEAPVLRVVDPGPPPPELAGGDYVVVHPGASVPARMWPAEHSAALVARLAGSGWRVVVTGGPPEVRLAESVAGGRALDLAGKLDLRGLAAVLAGACVLVVGNSGPAHLAAAVGTPVVSLFAPVVSAQRWRPWGVPHVLLGDQAAACAATRARECPVPGHPCLAAVSPEDAFRAVESLAGVRAAA